jgi:hypothetical protein
MIWDLYQGPTAMLNYSNLALPLSDHPFRLISFVFAMSALMTLALTAPLSF